MPETLKQSFVIPANSEVVISIRTLEPNVSSESAGVGVVTDEVTTDDALIKQLHQFKLDYNHTNRTLGSLLTEYGESKIWPGELSRLFNNLIQPSPERRKRILEMFKDYNY